MYENTNSNNTKQIISNYFLQDDNKSLYSLINNLKASNNSKKMVSKLLILRTSSWILSVTLARRNR